MKIMDIHCHIFPDRLAEKAEHSIGAFYGVPPGLHAGTETLLRLEREAGVTRCAFSSSATSPTQVEHLNTFLAGEARKHPGAIALGSIYPGMDGFEEELDRMIALGLRGVKIHADFQRLPIDDPSAISTYRAIAARRLPVLFHMGDARYDFSSPERLTNLVRQVPELTAIAAHFGGWRAWERSYAHPQPEGVWYDTSSTLPLVPRDMVLRMLDRFGPERFLFGTDFPMWRPADAVREFLALGLDEKTQEKILYGNFMKLFGLRNEEDEACAT